MFNKMALIYWRRGRHQMPSHLEHSQADMQLTEFFLHAHVVQAFTLWRANTASEEDHFQYLQSLMEELWTCRRPLIRYPSLVYNGQPRTQAGRLLPVSQGWKAMSPMLH
jgi:hypothetical protein